MKKIFAMVLVVLFTVSILFIGISCKTTTGTTAAGTTAAGTTAAGTTAAEEMSDVWKAAIAERDSMTEPTSDPVIGEFVKGFEIPKANKPFRVAALVQSLESDYYNLLGQNYQKFAEEAGGTVDVFDFDWNVEKEMTVLTDVLSKNYDGIIFTAEAAAAPLMIQKMRTAGIKAIVADINAFQEFGVPSVGANNYWATYLCGKYCAQYVNEHFNGIAKVAIVDWGDVAQSVINRREGFIAGLKNNVKDFTVVATQNGQAVQDVSMSVMENILQATPDINVAWGVNDPSALGVLAALEGAGYTKDKCIVSGFDASKPAIPEIKKGGMFLVDPGIDPIAGAKKEIELVVRILNGDTSIPNGEGVKAEYYWVPSPIVTIENADEWAAYQGF